MLPDPKKLNPSAKKHTVNLSVDDTHIAQPQAQPRVPTKSEEISQLLAETLGSEAWKLTPATFGHHVSGGKWKPAEHLLYISSVIASRIARGNARLIVSVPPRHGKSELMSVILPQWFLEKYPDRHVIVTSHTAELSSNFSRRVRDELIERQKAGLISVQIRSDAAKMAHFITTKGGSLFSAGVGGPITGRGAHLLIIDDYIKTAEEAESATIRQKISDWFKSVATTRVEPGGSIIILATRWHKSDLIGEVLGEQDSERRLLGYESIDQLSQEDKALLSDDQGSEGIDTMEHYEYIELPALADPLSTRPDPLSRAPGEALWPWRYNERFLEQRRRRLGPYFWKALYQQRPIPRADWLFSGDRVRYVDIPPNHENMQWVRAWDLASKEEAGADYTCGVLLGRDLSSKPPHIYIADVIRRQLTPAGVRELVIQTAQRDTERYGTVEILLEQEPGSAGVSVVDAYKKHYLRGYYVTVERPTGPKHIRANMLYASLEDGNEISFVRSIWNHPFIEELESFPSGDHDDQVDAAAYAFNRLCGPRPLGPTWEEEGPGSNIHDIQSGEVITGVCWA